MATREVSYNLAGAVRNQSLPVAGTTIILHDYWSTGNGIRKHYLAEITTGPKGEFSFDVRRGIYTLEVVPNRETRFARQSIETIKVTTNTTLTVQLKNGYLLGGRVRTTSGAAVSNCELLFFGIEPEPVRAIEKVDKDGVFNISLPKGRYQVACRHLPPAKRTKNGPPAFLCTTMGVLDLYSDLRDYDVMLPDMVPFKGVVTNADGHPVADVRATIKQSQPDDNPLVREAALMAVTYTNKIGQFECLVEPGLYDVKLEPGPDSHLSERFVASILVDQARTRTYSLAAGYRLSGQVTYRDEPVQNALVTVHGAKSDTSVLTDDDGDFAFSLSGGSYDLTVSAQPDSLAKLPFRLLAPFSTRLKLAEDTVQDVELSEGVSISGEVVDESGKPRPGVHLALFPQTGETFDTKNGAARPLAFGITGDDGSYEFRVVPDSYWLVINNQQSTAQLIDAQESDVEAELVWKDGCVVDFEIVSELDEAVSGCQVICEAYKAAATPPAEPVQSASDDAGVCRLSLPAGIYSFRFEPPASGSFQGKMIRQLSINSDLKRKVKLSVKAEP